MMRVGIIQPNFIPWRGYFDFIRSVDLFILLDDVQYTKNGWRARNKIKTPSGSQWLTVPVRNRGLAMRLDEALIDNTHDWRRKHAGSWQANYADAPWYGDLCELLKAMNESRHATLLTLNRRLIEVLCEYLGITTPIVLASEFKIANTRTEKVVDLLRAVEGTHYLSGPSADEYLDRQLFIDKGITLEYKSYDYPSYPQLWGPFDGAVTVLDVVANCGPSARDFLRSRTPDRVVIEPATRETQFAT